MAAIKTEYRHQNCQSFAAAVELITASAVDALPFSGLVAVALGVAVAVPVAAALAAGAAGNPAADSVQRCCTLHYPETAYSAVAP